MGIFEPNVASRISREVLRLFPEVTEVISEGDEELPYVFLGSLVDYLEMQANPDLPMQFVERILELDGWIRQQPRGSVAADDVLTIYVVGFIEKLFESEKLNVLIPRLLSKEDLLSSKPYLLQWIGEENFSRVLSLY